MNCPYCKAKPFKTTKGLTQHQTSSPKCFALIKEKFGIITGLQLPHNFVPFTDTSRAKNGTATSTECNNFLENARENRAICTVEGAPNARQRGATVTQHTIHFWQFLRELLDADCITNDRPVVRWLDRSAGERALYFVE